LHYGNGGTGCIESGGADRMALGRRDADDDGRSLSPRQVFFPMPGEKEGWDTQARSPKTKIDAERSEAYHDTVSLPFKIGAHTRIVLKIVADRGIESLKVLDLGLRPC
jgi:adenine-specific DNA-methyltransferase